MLFPLLNVPIITESSFVLQLLDSLEFKKKKPTKVSLVCRH